MDSEQRAARAKVLREDPILREIFDGLKAEAYNVFRISNAADQSQRDFAWMMVRVIDRIDSAFQAIVDDQHITLATLARAPK
jgi:hypothetical protein